MYERADHSSPPMRTLPPFRSTRCKTTALLPSSAAVPVRSAAGMWRWRLAIGRRIHTEAMDPPMKTSNWSTTPTPQSACAVDVLLERITDHHRLRGFDGERLEGGLEDRRVRLDAAVRARVDDRVHVETGIRDELRQIPYAVGHEPDLDAGRTQLFEDRQSVLEQLEVFRDLPAALDLGGAVGGDFGGSAHTDEDFLREAVPDRLVVQ